MADNINRIISGTARWASLTKPNTKFEPVWTIDLMLSADDAKSLKKDGFNVKKDDDGHFLKIKRRTVKRNLDPAEPPRVVDSKNNEWDGKLIGNGSQVKVKFAGFEYDETKPLAAYLNAVQVVDLVSYEEDFDSIEDGYVVGDEPNESPNADDELPF